VTNLKKIGFFMAFILPALLVAGYLAGGGWNYITVVFAFIIIPLIDQLAGLDTSNVDDSQVNVISEERYYRFVTYTWTYLQLGLLLWGCYAIVQDRLQTPAAWLGFVLSFSLITGGIGITVAHELGHKKSAIERFYSKLLLMTVCYMHFYIEHNRGHHVWVATAIDPATAKKNENFYSFWLRSVFGGYVHAWKLENDRLRKRGLPILHWTNEMIWFAIWPVVFCVSITAGFSFYYNTMYWEIPLFFFVQSILAFTLLELVNYVEHYGIERRELEPGKYERVNPLHSWNASHLISNFFLFQLQRHSDHHAYASKRYQVLKHHDDSPQLPYGYPTMILMALVPPLWFRAMNERLERWSTKTYQPAAPQQT
jgi:alkane 1-monooxygenase